jgi:membrane-anchored protein YejM (alkaline phosphatase superfamily)
MLFLAVAVPWISAYFEWEHYAHSTPLLPRAAWGWSQGPLVWAFYAKTQLLLAPVTALAAVLVAKGWWRSGWAAFLLWTGLVFLYVEVDKQAYTRTNVHLHEYLKFLKGPNATEWAGNLRSLEYLAKEALAITLKLSLAPLLVGVIAAGLLWRRSPGRWGPRVLRGLWVLWPLSVLAVAPAQRAWGDRMALQRLHALLPFDFRWSAPGMSFADTRKFAGPLNESLKDAMATAWPAIMRGVPADTDARFDGGPLSPNVILVAVESLRADAMTPEVMPRLCKLASRGLRLDRHFAGAKFSQFGLYNLLYARPAFGYQATISRDVPPQACVTFKRSGYQTHYVSSADHRGWMSMEVMASERTFDRMQLMLGGPWPACDHRALKEVRRLASSPAGDGGPPRFITAFLVSTHFPYAYPDTFGTRTPAAAADWSIINMRPERDRVPLLNRYHNSCAFLDAEIADMIEGLDLSRNVVVVTGDHGESFWDDDALAHGGRYSDAQIRVPCFMIGAGIAGGREVAGPTFHQDVLPTVLHAAAGRGVALRNITGRDLLSDAPGLAAQVLCAQSTDTNAEFLVTLDGGRRVLFEARGHRPELMVNGTVDRQGNIDPFDAPPAGETARWAGAIAEMLRRMTAVPGN